MLAFELSSFCTNHSTSPYESVHQGQSQHECQHTCASLAISSVALFSSTTNEEAALAGPWCVIRL